MARTEDIVVPEDRHRKEFTEQAIRELAESIKQHGLMHPIVVRADGKTLIAGERRLRACKLLGLKEIPCTQMQEVAAIELEEMELEENIRRRDLTFQERAITEARLHRLRTAQKAERGEKQTLDDTINELIVEGASRQHGVASLSENLVIADHLNDPEVKKAKDKKEAMRIIERKAREKQREAAAERFDNSKGPGSPHTVFLGDTRDLLSGLPADTFSVILTDPPYGMGADNFGDMAKVDHGYDDSPKHFQLLMQKVIPQLYRVSTENSHLYMFCDIEWFQYLRQLVSTQGFKPFRTPLIWCADSGMLPWIETGPRRRYEMILYAVKGNRPCNRVASDWMHYPRPQNQEYGAQKPVDLFSDLLSRSILPGEEVLDCFAGTGSILPAANRCNCRATAIELDKNKYNFMLERLEEV